MNNKSTITLTKTIVDRALPQSTCYHLWDNKLSGFGLRVGASGAKSYIVRYRAEGGGRTAPRRFMTVGRHGALTVDQARQQAKKLLAAAAVGQDPAGELSSKRKEMLLCELVDLYEREGCFIQRGKRQGQPLKPLTKQYTLSRMKNHLVPLLGSKRISDISIADVERYARDITTGKTVRNYKAGLRSRIIIRGGSGAAVKAVSDLSLLFSFAMRRELVIRNPVEKAAVCKSSNQRTRYLNLEEVARLGKAFTELEAEGANPKAIAIARLWALTGCRHNEIAALKWSEVDFEKGLLRLEDTKTGRSIRPLGSAAIAILRSIVPQEGSEYVFPATTGEGHFQGMKKIWHAAKMKAQLEDITPHTLRHTVGSFAISSGEAMALTGAILGHANPRSTAIYAHVQCDPMKLAAERVSNTIAEALGLLASSASDGGASPPRSPAPIQTLSIRYTSFDAHAPQHFRIAKVLAEKGFSSHGN